jgi:radical SAM superfamily enzyme YgiQ (UPF0313 family)
MNHGCTADSASIFMPHVSFVPFTGLRIARPDLLDLGLNLPGLRERADAIAQLPALGLLTLAGMLPADWTCSYHPAAGANQEDLFDRIIAERPAIVAVSALTASVEDAYAFCRKLRRARLPTVLGGLHATACADEARGHCDAVVLGEGEPVWPELLGDASAGELQPVYRAARDWDLAFAPLPRFDLLGATAPRLTVQTQRGCPLACEFCAASRLLGRFREKPAQVVARELKELGRSFPRAMVELADDNTFAGRRDAAEMCGVLHDAGVRYFTEADWRIGERPEVLGRLAASGCVQVLVGLESQVFRYPGMGEKQAAWERMLAAIHAIQEAGVSVNGCLIVGADGETGESIDRLVDFILASTLSDVQLTVQTPFPGTALRRRYRNEGRLLAERGWSYHTLFDVTYRPDRMSVEELEDGFRSAIEAVYSREASMRRHEIRRNVWKRNPRIRRAAREGAYE